MEDHRPPAQHLRARPATLRRFIGIEQVLDDDEVEAIECFFHLGDERLDGRVHRETGHQPVDWPIARDPDARTPRSVSASCQRLATTDTPSARPSSKRDEGSGGHVKVSAHAVPSAEPMILAVALNRREPGHARTSAVPARDRGQSRAADASPRAPGLRLRARRRSLRRSSGCAPVGRTYMRLSSALSSSRLAHRALVTHRLAVEPNHEERPAARARTSSAVRVQKWLPSACVAMMSAFSFSRLAPRWHRSPWRDPSAAAVAMQRTGMPTAHGPCRRRNSSCSLASSTLGMCVSATHHSTTDPLDSLFEPLPSLLEDLEVLALVRERAAATPPTPRP